MGTYTCCYLLELLDLRVVDRDLSVGHVHVYLLYLLELLLGLFGVAGVLIGVPLHGRPPIRAFQVVLAHVRLDA